MRVWWWTIRVLLGVELVYVLATSVFLNAGYLPKLINTEPQELRISYKFAISPFPGRVWAWGIDVRVEDPDLMMHFTLDRVSVDISLSELKLRQFHATRLGAKGLVFRFLVKNDPKKSESPRRALKAPMPVVQEKSPEVKTKNPKGPWKLRLERISVAGFRELWLEEYRFQGRANLLGSFFLHPGQGAQIERALIDVEAGTVRMGEEKVADGVQATLEAKLESFLNQNLRDLDILRNLTAHIKGGGTIDGVEFLDHYLGKVPSIHLHGGRGPLEIDMKIDHGKLAEGGSLTVNAQDLQADLWQQRLSGHARIDWKIAAGLGKLLVEYDRLALRHAKQDKAKIHGHKLSLVAESRELDLVKPFEDLRVRIDLPEAKIDDISYFEAYLPKGAGVKLSEGTGTVSAWLETASRRLLPERGALSLKLASFKATVADKELIGNAKVEGKMDKVGPRAGKVEIKGTRVTFDRVMARAVGTKTPQLPIGWWGEVLIPEGTFQVEPHVSFTGRITAKGRDARPILSLFGAKAGIPRIADSVLSMDGLLVEAVLDVDDHSFSVRDASAEGGDTKIKGWLSDDGPTRRRGKLLLQYGPFAVGLDVDGQETKFKLNDAFGWYDDPPRAPAQTK